MTASPASHDRLIGARHPECIETTAMWGRITALLGKETMMRALLEQLQAKHFFVLGLAAMLVLGSMGAALAGRDDEPARREEEAATSEATAVDDDDDDTNDSTRLSRVGVDPTDNDGTDSDGIDTTGNATDNDGTDSDGIDTTGNAAAAQTDNDGTDSDGYDTTGVANANWTDNDGTDSDGVDTSGADADSEDSASGDSSN